MSKWSYQGQDFESSMIPEGAEGFVYEMQAIINGILERRTFILRQRRGWVREL
jgi:hypothetical protein